MEDDRTALMSARALSPGYEILWYTIDRVLGQGGFGITYLANDRNLDRAVAIKEYLPTSFAYRHQDYSVKPITGDHRENFAWGLGSFLKEAQTLARFSHPNIVRVHSVFEENNTAYMVMEYEHGQNLAAQYKHREGLDQAFYERTFFPIFDGLKEIHKFDFIHRDIKPANIYIREDGTPVLIDFGSARQTTQQHTSEMTTLVSKGYTPLEQYSANYGDQGPWTDIYALAATLYEGIVGRKPEESLSRSACLLRSKPDLLEPLDARKYPGFSQHFLDAVFDGLRLQPEERPQSLEDWARIFDRNDAGYALPDAQSGFTTLESDDRTRLQPRPQSGIQTQSTELPFEHQDNNTLSSAAPLLEPAAASMDKAESADVDLFAHVRSSGDSEHIGSHEFDLAAQPSGDNSYRPEGTSAGPGRSERESTDYLPQDDLLVFDDDDVFTDSVARNRQAAAASTPQPGKGKGLLLGGIAAVVLLVGVGFTYYLGIGVSGGENLTAASLETMPRPATAVRTTLPEEHVKTQLSSLLGLANLLSQAYTINPSDETVLIAIKETETSLLALAKKWNATQHSGIASQIRTVSANLPAAVHDRGRIQGILSASGQVSSFEQVLALMEDKHYLQPDGDSVLDKITAVSASDYQKLKQSDSWATMMSEFGQTAQKRLGGSEFETAARLTEAVLTIDKDDAGFRELRVFLAGS